jgi:FKBP-type peptidyl-prolyl cis-trans isomerase FkpA
MKLKELFLLLLLVTITVYSCDDDDDDDKFDPEEQALLDDELLVDFLETHYLNENKRIDTILNGETPLFNQVEIENITYNEVNYKLYYYIDKQGVGENPTKNDSVQILYSGFTLDSIKFDENLSFASRNSWLQLPNLIPGWRFGVPNFRSGIRVIYPDESFGYKDTGTGIIFMPSGLAYGENGSGAIPQNAPIYFYLELGAVIRADSDNDGVINNLEDIDGDGDVINDDTDKDEIPDYVDIEDDGDGITTKKEDLNEDGNPRNDDTDRDGIPNYLDDDDDGDGKKTRKEDYNQNGNYEDDDRDNDGVPDYLDPDSK